MTQQQGRGSRWGSLVAISCAAVVLLAILAPRRSFTRGERGALRNAETSTVTSESPTISAGPGRAKTPQTAEEIVASKLNQFASDRLRITRAMAKRHQVELPDEVDQFFNAVAAGRWQELNELYHTLEKIRDGDDKLRSVWPPMMETLLVAECAHSWPAQKLLDYGQATLGSLSPGMIYVGGTDPGRGIPTLLNETSGGERHVLLTQNALADVSYLDYVRFLYGDQLTLPTEADSKQAFDSYLADAQRRFQHDQQFPDEPKQVLPGESIQSIPGAGMDSSENPTPQIEVSGNVAVMSINERIFQGILDKNPGASFAVEESYPFLSTYASATPLGPLMELQSPNAQNGLTLDTAGDALDYWRGASEQLQTDAEAPEGSEVRKSYSHMAVAQANLLASQNYPAEAEATYRIAMELEPSSTEAVYGLSTLLGQSGRLDEAQLLVNDFALNHPDQTPPPQSTFTIGSQAPPN
jgi:tetratricopeptide (TPR) repeat protein